MEPSTSSDIWWSSTEADAITEALQQMEMIDCDTAEVMGMWIFGYGSLCWNPGFSFVRSVTGYIRGFTRKFWQGNVTHRGTQKKGTMLQRLEEAASATNPWYASVFPKNWNFSATAAAAFYLKNSCSQLTKLASFKFQPGRVATLVEEDDGIVWGQAFQVKEKKTFSYLYNRECELGGYLTTITKFYPRQNTNDDTRKPFPVILYLATPSNSLWLGDSPLSEIANQIVECTGNSGHNVEYLLRLATFIRTNIPEAIDDHLFTLECLVRSEIKERKMCLKTLMGETKDELEGEKSETEEQSERSRTDTFQFTSTVPSKKLRCVNI